MPPAILLIQGIGLVGEGWRPQVDGLSGAFDPSSSTPAASAGTREQPRAALHVRARGTGDVALGIDADHGLRTRLGTRRMRRRAFLELVYPPAALAGRDVDALRRELAPLFGHDLADQPPIVMRQLRAMARYDACTRLAALGPIPTMVVSGELDRIARPAFGRELAAAIPNARYVELPGAAHGVPIHDAATVNTLLREHLGLTGTAGVDPWRPLRGPSD
jgi:pimeloyl-ACP methyl ester carboxylesterase